MFPRIFSAVWTPVPPYSVAGFVQMLFRCCSDVLFLCSCFIVEHKGLHNECSIRISREITSLFF